MQQLLQAIESFESAANNLLVVDSLRYQEHQRAFRRHRVGAGER